MMNPDDDVRSRPRRHLSLRCISSRWHLAVTGLALTVGVSVANPAFADEGSSNGTNGWWRSLNDPLLNDLVDEALANNYDLRTAAARVDQAHASKWQALTPTLPTLSADVNANAAPLNGLGFAFGGLPRSPDADEPTIFDPYFTGSAMLNARVTADLGSSIMNFRASGIEASASETDLKAQGAAVASRIASAYFDVVAAQAQVLVIEKQIASNRSLVEVVQMRYERGESSALDVLQQRQQLQSAEASLPQARSQARVLRFQLGLLVGRDAPVELAEAPSTFPELGTPPSREQAGELIDRRPDLASARKRVEAAESRVTAAWLSFLPRISVSGNAGYQFNWIDLEGDPNAIESWGASAGISVPLFNGLSRYSGLRTNQAAALAARATYEAQRRQRLLAVEQARVQEEEFLIQLAAAQRQVEIAHLSVEKSREQYLAGLAPLTSVLIATTSAQAGELNTLNIRRRLLESRLQLLDALGGEWAFDLPPPEEMTSLVSSSSAPVATISAPADMLSPDAPRRTVSAESGAGRAATKNSETTSSSAPFSPTTPVAPAALIGGAL